jgi:hypothetical protein
MSTIPKCRRCSKGIEQFFLLTLESYTTKEPMMICAKCREDFAVWIGDAEFLDEMHKM